MADQDELAGILAAVGRGDRAAFRRLYDATAAKLFGVTLRICHDRSIAEDALQDAFAEIWRKAGSFDADRGRVLSWMAVIARNRSIDALRRRSRDGNVDQPLTDEIEEAVIDPTQKTDGGVEYLALMACLDELDAQSREAVLRAYYRGESREELAERFDAPVATVKTRLRRGLARLKGCLERE